MRSRYVRAMRACRESFIPLTRIFGHERAKVAALSDLAGYSMADLVRASLGLETERPASKGVVPRWHASPTGTLLYKGKSFTVDDVAQLLNNRCVAP
jgi:hypothetical protein